MRKESRVAQPRISWWDLSHLSMSAQGRVVVKAFKDLLDSFFGESSFRRTPESRKTHPLPPATGLNADREFPHGATIRMIRKPVVSMRAAG